MRRSRGGRPRWIGSIVLAWLVGFALSFVMPLGLAFLAFIAAVPVLHRLRVSNWQARQAPPAT